MNQTEQLVNVLGKFSDKDQYSNQSILQTIMNEQFLFDYNDPRGKRLNFSQFTPKDAFVYRMITIAFKSASDELFTQELIRLLYDNLPSKDLDILNVGASMLAAEYYFREYNLLKYRASEKRDANVNKEERRFKDWVSDAKEWAEKFSLESKKGQDLVETRQPLSLFDMVRYYRYFSSQNVPIIKEKLQNPYKVTLTNLKKVEECKSDFNPKLFLPNYKDVLPSSKTVPVIVDEEKMVVELYPYDTDQTIHDRVAALLKIPSKFLKLRETRLTCVNPETIKQFVVGDKSVKVIYTKECNWSYNPLENNLYVYRTVPFIYKTLDQLTNGYRSFAKALVKISKFEDELTMLTKDEWYVGYLLHVLNAQGREIKSLKNYETFISSEEFELADEIQQIVGKDFKTILEEFINAKVSYNDLDNRWLFSQYLGTEINPDTDPIVSSVKQTEYSITGTFALKRIDIYQLFNNLIVDASVPFARVGAFVKAINNVKIPEEWEWSSEELEEDVFIFYLSYTDSPSRSKDAYTSKEEFIRIQIKEVMSVESITSFSFTFESSDETLEDVIINKMISCINPIPDTLRLTRAFSGGLALINNFELSPQAFHDFALNNPIIRDTIKINEKGIIYKQKGGIKFQIMLSRNSEAFVKATLNLKKIEKNNDPEKLYFNAAKNSYVWSLQIQGTLSTPQTEQLVSKFAKALVIMKNSMAEWYYSYYCKFITDIYKYTAENVIKPEQIEKSVSQAKDIAPEIFVNRYIRRCDEHPVPILYEQESAKSKEEELKKMGVDYLVYPQEGMKNFDGSKSKRYFMYCPAGTYVGLIQNTNLSNKEQYPYIPCCYKTFADDKTLAYKEGKTFAEIKEIEDQREKKNRAPIKTNKLLSEKSIGFLPSRLERLFALLDEQALIGNKEFYRIGVPDNYSGKLRVIEAMLLATKKGFTVDQCLNKLAEIAKTGILRSTGLTIEEALSIIKNKEYFDPRAWLPALRIVFEYEIILTCPETILCSEYFQRYRVVNEEQKLYNGTVILYVHLGGEFDDYDIPQSEVVIRVNSNTSISEKRKEYHSHFLTANSDGTNMVQTLFNMLDEMYPTHKIKWSLPKDSKVINQMYDSYGKTRGLIVRENNNLLTYITDPINNLTAEEQRGDDKLKVYRTEDREIFGKNTEPVVFNNNVIGYYKLAGNVGSFVFTEEGKYQGMREKYNTNLFSYPIPVSKHVNFAMQYKNFSKIANILKSYAFWLFSRAYPEPEVANAYEWAQNCIKVQTVSENIEAVYKEIAREFSTASPLVDKSDRECLRVIVNSEREGKNIKKRLFYMLKLAVEYQYSVIVDYKNLRYIPAYFNSADEFKTNDLWTVYNTPKDYQLMTRGTRATYDVYGNLFVSEESYFVSLKEDISQPVYLAVQAKSIDEAYNIAVNYEFERNVYKTDRVKGKFNVQIYDNDLNPLPSNIVPNIPTIRIGVLGDIAFALVDYMKFM